MKVLVNYANEPYRRSQQQNSKSGLKIGEFDKAWSYGPADIDSEFAVRNRHILSQPRGGGYWLWKPYFVHHALQRLSNGDYLFYCDSGSFFLGPVQFLIDLSIRTGEDLLCFDLPFIEKVWTKRDALVLLDCDQPRYFDSLQRTAAFSLWKKTESTVSVSEEWLDLAQDERLITDLPCQLDLANREGFREHRHDQSIFSLITKRRGIPAFRNPGQIGNQFVDDYPNSDYPQLIEHTRAKVVPLKQKLSREMLRLARQSRRLLSR